MKLKSYETINAMVVAADLMVLTLTLVAGDWMVQDIKSKGEAQGCLIVYDGLSPLNPAAKFAGIQLPC